jgi:hypothetical protein
MRFQNQECGEINTHQFERISRQWKFRRRTTKKLKAAERFDFWAYLEESLKIYSIVICGICSTESNGCIFALPRFIHHNYEKTTDY